MFVFHLEADLEPRTAAAGMARDSALSALSTLPDVVACVASPRTDAGKKISCGRHDAQERQRHKAADGEQRHQIVVPGGGQVQDDFEDVEHGLDQVSDVFHVPWYAFAGHVYARSRFWWTFNLRTMPGVDNAYTELALSLVGDWLTHVFEKAACFRLCRTDDIQTV
ncbi:hypothetical protein GT994_09745 [Bifidobacterium longum]|uniref:Uncharacterized protein n=1 Tax=Bifidobacterium longum TaxID=216816 RepID=A0A9Q4XA33_BIFLN|nr:hypothetical protein GBL36_07540 [Bifidobacterium longum]KAB6721948.1 hypothetical protein GBL29_06275 [Bifidobacterium longum]KAB6722260.1 hypothetical protein GBL27_06380 [Bifidobacterium longum]KAB6726747.1 hypothetical protein GBL26_05975 [Bifidobacterium longum]KAB6728423.1 hypothetical protein GBL17_06300 [Bifidobacterium longum]